MQEIIDLLKEQNLLIKDQKDSIESLASNIAELCDVLNE